MLWLSTWNLKLGTWNFEMEDSPVIYAIEGSVALVTLNRPEKRNALVAALVAALKDALRDADTRDEVRAVVVTGAGADFCSGADLSALKKISEGSVEDNLADARSLMELYALIRSVRVPVVAAVRGRALAGGCGLATACDIVLAASSACFGYPEVKIGFVPAMVMAILRRNVSEKRAFELITRGEEQIANHVNVTVHPRTIGTAGDVLWPMRQWMPKSLLQSNATITNVNSIMPSMKLMLERIHTKSRN